MPTKIVSFGFRHGLSIEGVAVFERHERAARKVPQYIKDCLVIDVRGWLPKNPYHDKRLRKMRGTDKDVQDNIRETPNFAEVYGDLKQLVSSHDGPVYIGCTGGHHRSVYLAILLSQAFSVPVEHLDITKA